MLSDCPPARSMIFFTKSKQHKMELVVRPAVHGWETPRKSPMETRSPPPKRQAPSGTSAPTISYKGNYNQQLIAS